MSEHLAYVALGSTAHGVAEFACCEECGTLGGPFSDDLAALRTVRAHIRNPHDPEADSSDAATEGRD